MNKSKIETDIIGLICQLCQSEITNNSYLTPCCQHIIDKNCRAHICHDSKIICLSQNRQRQISQKEQQIKCESCLQSLKQFFICNECISPLYPQCKECFLKFHETPKLRHHTKIQKTPPKISLNYGKLPYKPTKGSKQLEQLISNIFKQQKSNCTYQIIKSITQCKFKEYNMSVIETKQTFTQIISSLQTSVNQIIDLLNEKLKEFRMEIERKEKRQLQKIKKIYGYQHLVETNNLCKIVENKANKKNNNRYHPEYFENISKFLSERLKKLLHKPTPTQSQRVITKSQFEYIDNPLKDLLSQTNKLELKKILNATKAKNIVLATNRYSLNQLAPQKYYFGHKINQNSVKSNSKNDNSLSFASISFKKTRQNKKPTQYTDSSILMSEKKIINKNTKKLKKIKSESKFPSSLFRHSEPISSFQDSNLMDISIDESFRMGFH